MTGWTVVGVQAVFMPMTQDEEPSANALQVTLVQRGEGDTKGEQRAVLVSAGFLAALPGRVDRPPLYDGQPAPRDMDRKIYPVDPDGDPAGGAA